MRSKALRKSQNVLTLNVIRPDDPLYARPAEGWLRPRDDDEEEESRVQVGYSFGEFYNFWNGSPPWGFKNWQTIAQSKGYKHLEENLQTSGFLMLQFTKSKCASSAPHLCSAGKVLEHSYSFVVSYLKHKQDSSLQCFGWAGSKDCPLCRIVKRGLATSVLVLRSVLAG